MRKSAIEWNFNVPNVLGWGLGGAAVGAGARLAKYIADVSRDRDVTSAVDVKRTVPPVAEIPTEVSEEEAAKLRQQGIPVKEASVADVFAGAGLGALGTLGVYGGWKALDATFDKQRKNEAKQRLERARQRVERLLGNTPERQDIKLAAAMHAAEEVFFEKRAEGVGDKLVGAAADALATPFTYVAPAVGAIATLAAVAGFNRARESNKNTQKARELRQQYVERRPVEPPMATLVPVLKRKKTVGASPATQAAEA
jgi:hypothetical protein